MVIVKDKESEVEYEFSIWAGRGCRNCLKILKQYCLWTLDRERVICEDHTGANVLLTKLLWRDKPMFPRSIVESETFAGEEWWYWEYR